MNLDEIKSFAQTIGITIAELEKLAKSNNVTVETFIKMSRAVETAGKSVNIYAKTNKQAYDITYDYRKAITAAAEALSLQKKNITNLNSEYKEQIKTVGTILQRYNLMNKSDQINENNLKDKTKLIKHLRILANAQSKEEQKNIQKLTGEYKGIISQTKAFVATKAQTVFGINKMSMATLGLTANLNKLLDTLIDYRTVQFSVSRNAQIFGKSFDNIGASLAYVRKNTILSDQQFMSLVNTFQRGYIGVAKTSSEVGRLAKVFQSAFGPNVKEIESRMGSLLGVMNKFPALGKQIESAAKLAQESGDPQQLERYKGQIVATGMALGLSAEEWDTISKLTTKTTAEQQRLNEAAALRAKYEQTVANVTLQISEVLDKIITSTVSWAKENKPLVDFLQMGLDVLTKYPVQIMAIIAGLKGAGVAAKALKGYMEFKAAKQAVGGGGGFGGFGGGGGPIMIRNTFGSPIYTKEIGFGGGGGRRTPRGGGGGGGMGGGRFGRYDRTAPDRFRGGMPPRVSPPPLPNMPAPSGGRFGRFGGKGKIGMGILGTAASIFGGELLMRGMGGDAADAIETGMDIADVGETIRDAKPKAPSPRAPSGAGKPGGIFSRMRGLFTRSGASVAGKTAEVTGEAASVVSKTASAASGASKIAKGLKIAGKGTAVLSAAFMLKDVGKLFMDFDGTVKEFSGKFEEHEKKIRSSTNKVDASMAVAGAAFDGLLDPVQSITAAAKATSDYMAARGEMKEAKATTKATQEKFQTKYSKRADFLKTQIASGSKEAREEAKRMLNVYKESKQTGGPSPISDDTAKKIENMLDPANKEMQELTKLFEKLSKEIEKTTKDKGLFLMQKQLAESKQNTEAMVSLFKQLSTSANNLGEVLAQMGDASGAKGFLEIQVDSLKSAAEEYDKYMKEVFSSEGFTKAAEKAFEGTKIDFSKILEESGTSKEEFAKASDDELKKLIPQISAIAAKKLKENPITGSDLKQMMDPNAWEQLSNEIKTKSEQIDVAFLMTQKKVLEQSNLATGEKMEAAFKAMKASGGETDFKDFAEKLSLAQTSKEDLAKASEEDAVKIKQAKDQLGPYLQELEKIEAVQEAINSLTNVQQARVTVTTGFVDAMGNKYKSMQDYITGSINLLNKEAETSQKFNSTIEERLNLERELMEAAQFGMGASIEMMQKQVNLQTKLMNVEGKRIKDIDKDLQSKLEVAGVDKQQAATATELLGKAESMEDRQKIISGLNIQDVTVQQSLLQLTQNRDTALNKQMQAQKKIYELTKEMREGYLDAIREMSVGAGEFEKIIGTQEMGVTQLMGAVDKFTQTGQEGMLNTMKLGGMQSTSMTTAGVGTQYAGQYTTGGAKFIGKDEQEQRNKRIFGYQASMDQYEKMKSGETEASIVGTGVAGEVTTDTANAVRDGAFDGVKEGAKEGITEAFKASGVIMVSNNRGSPVGNMPVNPATKPGGGRFTDIGKVNPNEVTQFSLGLAAQAQGGRADASTIATMPLGGFSTNQPAKPSILNEKSTLQQSSTTQFYDLGDQKLQEAQKIRKTVSSLYAKRTGETETAYYDRLAIQNPSAYGRIKEAEMLESEGQELKGTSGIRIIQNQRIKNISAKPAAVTTTGQEALSVAVTGDSKSAQGFTSAAAQRYGEASADTQKQLKQAVQDGGMGSIAGLSFDGEGGSGGYAKVVIELSSDLQEKNKEAQGVLLEIMQSSTSKNVAGKGGL